MAHEDEAYSECSFDFTFDELYDAFNELMDEYKKLDRKNKEMKSLNQTLNE